MIQEQKVDRIHREDNWTFLFSSFLRWLFSQVLTISSGHLRHDPPAHRLSLGRKNRKRNSSLCSEVFCQMMMQQQEDFRTGVWDVATDLREIAENTTGGESFSSDHHSVRSWFLSSHLGSGWNLLKELPRIQRWGEQRLGSKIDTISFSSYSFWMFISHYTARLTYFIPRSSPLFRVSGFLTSLDGGWLCQSLSHLDTKQQSSFPSETSQDLFSIMKGESAKKILSFFSSSSDDSSSFLFNFFCSSYTENNRMKGGRIQRILFYSLFCSLSSPPPRSSSVKIFSFTDLHFLEIPCLPSLM